MFKLFLLVLTCLAFLSLQTQPQCTQPHPQYTQAMLVLQWPGSYCSRKQCLQQWSQWNGHNFVIRGYWPTYDSQDLNCLYSVEPDPQCGYTYEYQWDKLDEALQNSMERYWPQWDVTAADKQRAYQWDKHGVCYLNITKSLVGDNYNEDQIFYGYFLQTIIKAKNHLFVSQFSFDTKEALRQQLQIPNQRYFYVMCYSDDRSAVKQVRICYNLAEPGAQTYVECYEQFLEKMHEPCIYPVYLEQRSEPEPPQPKEETIQTQEKQGSSQQM